MPEQTLLFSLELSDLRNYPLHRCDAMDTRGYSTVFF